MCHVDVIRRDAHGGGGAGIDGEAEGRGGETVAADVVGANPEWGGGGGTIQRAGDRDVGSEGGLDVNEAGEDCDDPEKNAMGGTTA